ncbi:MAG: hypothetical protein MRY64_12690 [Hyphomonadaceae bacterium]|nr:hypothetical protein [Hyphomonadaceae bacterium]
MAQLFDAYVMVDWSAAAKPVTGANSIWVGILAKDARLKFQFRAVNPETRLKARDFIADMVGKLTRRGDKVLLGFDFSLGYPAGTAGAMGLKTDTQPPWKAQFEFLTSKVREKPDNSNARFAIAAGMNYAISKGPFPFWGAPARDQVSTLQGTRPDYGPGAHLPEFRLTERHLREARLGQPKSCWQLAYAGSVGSQTLLGIPHVAWLREHLDAARIWPFELGLEDLTEERLEDISVVIAEIYPSMIKAKPAEGQVLDAAQVEAIARHYWDLDAKGALGMHFSGPKDQSEAEMSQITAEEGWILGT